MFDETASVSWVARFGTSPPTLHQKLDAFLRHRSVRKYSTEPVSEELVTNLVAVAQSASTSSNLQLWSLVSVQEPEQRQKVAQLCGDQKQIHNAPWFFVFVADHARLKRAAESVGEECLGLDYNEFFTMALIDASLAAERFVCAAETLGLGCCYIGAVRNDPSGVKELLRLPEGAAGVFGLCLGWPADGIKAEVKPRLSSNCVWFREHYAAEVEIGDYDERMSEFYARQGMASDDPWSLKSGKRVDEHHLTGRDRLKEFLNLQGFDRR